MLGLQSERVPHKLQLQSSTETLQPFAYVLHGFLAACGSYFLYLMFFPVLLWPYGSDSFSAEQGHQGLSWGCGWGLAEL